MSDGHGIPASWYPDPVDNSKLRYWDGSGWTQDLRDATVRGAPNAMVSGIGASAVNAPLTDLTGYDHIGHSSSYVPFSRDDGALLAAHLRRETGSPSTIAIWLYALVPLLLLVHHYIPWTFTSTDFINPLIHGALGLVRALLAILLAAIDRSQLRNRGFERTPPRSSALCRPSTSLRGSSPPPP